MIYAFEDYVLDTDGFELRCGDEPVRLEPQVLEVLAYLVAHRDRVVPKGEGDSSGTDESGWTKERKVVLEWQ